MDTTYLFLLLTSKSSSWIRKKERRVETEVVQRQSHSANSQKNHVVERTFSSPVLLLIC
jgi:hypothetical protein